MIRDSGVEIVDVKMDDTEVGKMVINMEETENDESQDETSFSFNKITPILQ